MAKTTPNRRISMKIITPTLSSNNHVRRRTLLACNIRSASTTENNKYSEYNYTSTKSKRERTAASGVRTVWYSVMVVWWQSISYTKQPTQQPPAHSVVSRTRTQKHIGGIFGLMEVFCNGSVGVSFYACMPSVRETDTLRKWDEYMVLSHTHKHPFICAQNLVSLLHHSPFCLSIIATVIVIIMIVYCIAFLYFYCRVHRVRSTTLQTHSLAIHVHTHWTGNSGS